MATVSTLIRSLPSAVKCWGSVTSRVRLPTALTDMAFGHVSKRRLRLSSSFFSATTCREFTTSWKNSKLHMTFIDENEDRHELPVVTGENLLTIAQRSALQLEGACGGECACSTCHVIVTDEEFFQSIPEPSEDEDDMLDMAHGRTKTSRLGCQVKMTEAIGGIVVRFAEPSRTKA